MTTFTEQENYYRADNLVRFSCETLQNLFRTRWKQSTGNDWSEINVNELVNGPGKNAYQFAKPMQRKLITSGVVEDWDITILARLLVSITPRDREEDVKVKRENQTIQILTKMRNQVAHNSLKKLTVEEYCEIEDIFANCLETLGISQTEIQKLIEQAKIISSVSAFDQAQKIQEKGDKRFAKKQFNEAIEIYNEALLVPNLTRNNQAKLYEKRAACYLELGLQYKRASTESLDQALKDINHALEINGGSWEGHQLIAKIYRAQNQLENSLAHYKRALAISPGQTKVKEEMESVILLLGIYDREDHLAPSMLPTTLSECVEKLMNETRIFMTEKKLLDMGNSSGKLIKGQDHVHRGHQYRMGWEVKQSWTEAAAHYSKAAKVGNADGMFNLAELYKEGKGVKQDIQYALELLNRAVQLPPKIRIGNLEHVDMGVRAAQLSLGLMHSDGIGVPQDYTKAAFWYEKAAKTQCGSSANNLAILYFKGQGVPRDEKKAIVYWKLAVAGKSKNAAYFLFLYYFQHMELDQARSMFNTSVELGNDRLLSEKDHYFEQIEKRKKKREEMEESVLKFEKEHNLPTRGLTFLERSTQMMSHDNPIVSKMLDVMEERRAAETNSHTKWAGQAKDFDFKELIQKAFSGSVTAKRVVATFEHNSKFIELWGSGPPFSESKVESLINEMYACNVLEQHLFRIPAVISEQVEDLLRSLLRSKGSRPCELDRKVRLCFAYQISNSDPNFIIEILKEAIRRYPTDEAQLYSALSNKYGLMQQHQLGLKVAINGLLQFPNYVDLLYARACHQRLVPNANGSSTIPEREAFAAFIKHAPKDHRHLPDAYYWIGITYTMEKVKLECASRRSKVKKKQNLEQIQHYYDLGQAAEKDQLSCYLPYTSSGKDLLELHLINTQKDSMKKFTEKYKSLQVTETKLLVTSKSKVHLTNPARVNMINDQRKSLMDLRKAPHPSSVQVNFGFTKPPKYEHKIPKVLNNLKGIYLNEMNPTRDHVFENRILTLTIIEDPLLGFSAVHLIAEDENGDATYLHIYNVPQNEDIYKTLGFGCRLSIINPYMRLALDSTNGIRVDDTKCIIYLEEVNKMCRYCCAPDANQTCAQCKKARYCSKECQIADWKKLGHKMICVK